jgi:hypothetical protein
MQKILEEILNLHDVSHGIEDYTVESYKASIDG